jgi:Protein of unknown function (DUF2380)
MSLKFIVAAIFLFVFGSHPALAGQKTVVFPFDLSLQQKEEDFFIGAGKPTEEEQARLKLVNDELVKLLGNDKRYSVVDIAPIAKDIEAAAPLNACNGCEIDLAKKAGGEIAFTGLIDKASATLLNMQIGILDVASGKALRTASVVVQGNTDEAWLRAVRWLMKNRLLAEATAQ